MNFTQFQTALLEAQQRARLAIGAFTESMTPTQPQGVQNAQSNSQAWLQDQEIRQRPDSAGPSDLPPR